MRDKMCLGLEEVGLTVERSHHEVGTAGQQEINYRFNTLLQSGDDIMKFKYVIKNVAWHGGKTATFMPKPIFGDNGSGMHTHQSLWKDGEPLFYDERGYGGLSDIARWYIGGLLKHAPSMLAFTNPTAKAHRPPRHPRPSLQRPSPDAPGPARGPSVAPGCPQRTRWARADRGERRGSNGQPGAPSC
jgi:glutamine synthetase